MLFIYGEEGGRYEVVNSSDGTSMFYTLDELGEIKERVLGYCGSHVELDWLRNEMAKRALVRGSSQIEELNLYLSESTGLEETGQMKGLGLLRKMEREVGMDFTSFTEEASYNRKLLIKVLREPQYSI